MQQSVNIIIQNVVEKYSPAAGSKCIRSKLALLYMCALGIEITDTHRSFLTAIELLHNASLLHDDILDEAETRRGQMVRRDKKALITGDYLAACTIQTVPLNLVPMLAKTLENMCLGEFTQLEAKNVPLRLEQYLLKTEQKTAGLFVAALEGCLNLCGEDTSKHLPFAHNFGMLYQIKNDIAGREKDEAKGILNIHATKDLLHDYTGQALENLAALPEGEYKRELERLVHE